MADPHARSMALAEAPQWLRLGVDVEERPAWGIDCFTHRCYCQGSPSWSLDHAGVHSSRINRGTWLNSHWKLKKDIMIKFS